MSAGPKAIKQPLSAEQVRKVAKLARLDLSDEQVERYREQLGAVLAYVDRLGDLDLSGIEPLANPVEETNRLAKDEPAAGLPRQVLMDMAPHSAAPFVSVPRVLGDSTS